MGLDVWFRQDVARILASTQETLASSLGAVPPLDRDLSGIYRQGFSDALQAIAVAFGLQAPGSVPAPRAFADPPLALHREAWAQAGQPPPPLCSLSGDDMGQPRRLAQEVL
jgi:hypothetical protein